MTESLKGGNAAEELFLEFGKDLRVLGISLESVLRDDIRSRAMRVAAALNALNTPLFGGAPMHYTLGVREIVDRVSKAYDVIFEVDKNGVYVADIGEIAGSGIKGAVSVSVVPGNAFVSPHRHVSGIDGLPAEYGRVIMGEVDDAISKTPGMPSRFRPLSDNSAVFRGESGTFHHFTAQYRNSATLFVRPGSIEPLY